MGQNGLIPNNPMFIDWKQSSQQPIVYINVKTNDQVERYIVTISKENEFLFKRRIHQQHGFITKVVYYQPQPNNQLNSPHQLYQVYTQRMMPIKKSKWLPVITALSILKGFRRLSTTYGLMRIIPQMIGMNEKDQIKVWINKKAAANQPTQKANNQQQMLADIAQIIVKYDSDTGGLLIGCLTLNQAINNVLMSMADGRSQSNLSNRTLRLEDNSRNLVNKGEISEKNNLFRETKQTQDQLIKPLQSDKSVGRHKTNIAGKSQLLRKVHLPTSPRYITTNQERQPILKINELSNHQKQFGAKHSHLNFSEQIHVQKQSSNQINTSQPEKKIDFDNSKKYFRPVQYNVPEKKAPIGTSNIIDYRKIPKYQPMQKNVQSNENHKNYLRKYESGSDIHQLQRRSDLNREVVYGRDQGRASDFTIITQTSMNKNFNNKSRKDQPFYTPVQKQEKFSKSMLHKHKNLSPKPQQGFVNYSDNQRTKTQQFTTLNFSSESPSNTYKSSVYEKNKPEFKSKQLKEYSQVNFNKKKPIHQKITHQKCLKEIDLVDSTKFCQKEKEDPGKLQKIRSHPTVTYNSNHSETENSTDFDDHRNYQEKKVKKKQLSNLIRDQFSNILSPSQGDTKKVSGVKQKSSKDVLIRQKIENKKAKYADLKTETMKILLAD